MHHALALPYLYWWLMPPDLADDERATLLRRLRRTLDYDPYSLAPRLDPLKAILAGLAGATTGRHQPKTKLINVLKPR